MKITAIAASYNRRTRTLACLASYFAQDIGPSVTLTAVLVDDASTDGTAEAVRTVFPSTRVIGGTGNLFWASAMAVAEREAFSNNPDFLLWLNDDVVLDRDALSRLIETASCRADDCIAVGALRDPISGELTYSGVRRHGLHPLRVALVAPKDEPVEVTTFNGNVVLVPRSVTTKVGPIDGAFAHAAADFDYGLRATYVGVCLLLAPSTVGTCSRDGDPHPWVDPKLTLSERFRVLFGPKGLPPRARARYLIRHGGPMWPVFWLAPYVSATAAIIRQSFCTRDAQ
jgi:GT2 family glycosyltransferase